MAFLELDAEELKTDRNTVREHGTRNVEIIRDSVQETGFCRGVFIDEENEVLAGKGVVLEAQRRGAKVLVVDVDDPNTLVAIRRTGLTERQKDRAMLWDNHASDLSRNNKSEIVRLAEKNPTQMLLMGIFTPEERAVLLDKKFESASSQLFDSSKLDGAASVQPNTAFLIYLSFPDQESLNKALSWLSNGKRKPLAPGQRQAVMNGEDVLTLATLKDSPEVAISTAAPLDGP